MKAFDNSQPQTCARCGREFFYNRKRKYCDDKCQKLAQLEKAKTERAKKVKPPKPAKQPKQQRKQNSSKKLIQSITYICSRCGKEYHPKARDRNKYCSRECAYADKAKPIVVRENPICSVCGKEFEGRADRKYCSDECRKDKERKRYALRSLMKRICAWCGEEFTPQYKAGTRAYCCDDHGRLARIEQRKQKKKTSPSAKMHKGGVSKAKRQRVFKRDGCVCQICNKPMKMDKIDTLASGHPHPLAPTADHIIPVSIAKQLGWSNEEINAESNLQSAHFICNVKKGNKAINEQLRLA